MKNFLSVFGMVWAILLPLFLPPLLALLPVPVLVPSLLGGTSLLILVFLAVRNGLKARKFRRILLEAPVSEIGRGLIEEREEIVTDGERARKKLGRALVLLKLYPALLVFLGAVLTYAVLCFVRLATSEWPAEDIALLFVISGCLLFFFLEGEPLALGLSFRVRQKCPAPLSRDDYPLLYEIADRAASEMGFSGKFILTSDGADGNIGLLQAGNTTVLGISPIASLLTEEELFSVFLHEFAHAVHGDAAFTEKLRRCAARYSEGTLTKVSHFLFLHGFAEEFSKDADIYLTYISPKQEAEADREAAACVSAEIFGGTLVKLALFGEFGRGKHPELEYFFYENETPAAGYFQTELALFERSMSEIAASKTEILMRELPSRSASHPTLGMRLERIGAKKYDLCGRPAGDLLFELQKLTRFCDFCRRPFGAYEEIRREMYLIPKARMEKFGCGNRYETDLALFDFLKAYPERALPAAEEVLKERESPAAKFVKGYVLAMQDDPACLPLLLELSKTSPYFGTDAFELLANTVCRTGDEALLENMRAEQTEVAAMQMSYLRRISKLKFRRLASPDLPEEELAAFRKIAEDAGCEIYIARMKGEEVHAVFAVSSKESADVLGYLFSQSVIGGRCYQPFMMKKIPKKVKKVAEKIG